MSVLLRNNAATAGAVDRPKMGSGGGRDVSGGVGAGAVRRKVRFASDPAGELMPAAEFLGTEPDFSAILEDFKDSPFDPRKRKVLGRLMGVFAMDYQGARPQERVFLRRLLRARNAREGYAANRALHLCGASPVVRRTLALGVAEARFEEGPIRGFLGSVQARVAATTFTLLGPLAREQVWTWLTLAGRDGRGKALPGADPVIECALVFKALAARRHVLGPWSKVGAQALAEVGTFAEALRGAPRPTLAARTTLFPGDPDRTAEALARWDGAQRAAGIARAEIDPVFAWNTHAADVEAAPFGRKTPSAEDGYAQLPELDRALLLDRPRLHQALAEARALGRGGLTPVMGDAVKDYVAGRELSATRLQEKDAALTLIAREGFDVARPEAIEAIREDARGIYKFDAAVGMGLLLSRYTGAMYVRRVMSDQMTAGSDPLGAIDSALHQGLAVPLIVQELRLDVARAWAAVAAREEFGEAVFELRKPDAGELAVVRPSELSAKQLPAAFGKRARLDTFLAPAALDLLAPPFGIAFPEIGITDRL